MSLQQAVLCSPWTVQLGNISSLTFKPRVQLEERFVLQTAVQRQRVELVASGRDFSLWKTEWGLVSARNWDSHLLQSSTYFQHLSLSLSWTETGMRSDLLSISCISSALQDLTGKTSSNWVIWERTRSSLVPQSCSVLWFPPADQHKQSCPVECWDWQHWNLQW